MVRLFELEQIRIRTYHPEAKSAGEPCAAREPDPCEAPRAAQASRIYALCSDSNVPVSCTLSRRRS
jgi:hypothetical protein